MFAQVRRRRIIKKKKNRLNKYKIYIYILNRMEVKQLKVVASMRYFEVNKEMPFATNKPDP